MNDCKGKELTVGDKVIASHGVRYRERKDKGCATALYGGRVIRLTPKKLEIEFSTPNIDKQPTGGAWDDVKRHWVYDPVPSPFITWTKMVWPAQVYKIG